jgi:hypothetical protein
MTCVRDPNGFVDQRAQCFVQAFKPSCLISSIAPSTPLQAMLARLPVRHVGIRPLEAGALWGAELVLRRLRHNKFAVGNYRRERAYEHTAVINEVEQLASRNEKVRKRLAGVWNYTSTDEVHAREQKAAEPGFRFPPPPIRGASAL